MELRNQYLKRNINTYNIKKITYPRKAQYKQTAANCWLYSMFNNAQLNLWFKINEQNVINILNMYQVDTNKGGDKINAAVTICAAYPEKNLMVYTIDVLKNPKLVADMLVKWYSFAYSRDCSAEVLADILDNGRIDKIHKWITAPHATNITLDWKQLRELWSRWDFNKANTFVFDNVITFIWCVRAKAIKSELLFIDYA